MRIDVVFKMLVAILFVALLSASMPVFAASSLTSGYATVKDWDKTSEAFSFSSGQVTMGGGDFFIAPRGIHVFDSPGIIDMGLISLNDIVEAPASGYVEMATPLDGHSYVVRSNGKYGKFYIDETYDWLNPVEYGIQWVYQIDGTRSFEGTAATGQTTTTGQTGTGCTYEQYIAAYNKLTSLMSAGKGNTPEATAAYEEYAKMKACYESSLSGTGSSSNSGQTGTGGVYECPQDVKEAYQQYIAAYNKLVYLNSEGEGNTPAAQIAYEQYAKAKACYESRISGTGSTSTAATTTTTSGQTFAYRSQDWIPYQTGQGTVSLGQDEICISSMNPGGAWSQATRVHDISTDYTVELDFKVTEQNNHFIVIYSDGYLFLDVDWGRALSHHQPGASYSLHQIPVNLQVNQWYRIRMDAHPAQETFDVYIDGSKVSTATGISKTEADAFHKISPQVANCIDCIYFGDPDDISYQGGSYNRGSACWKNITVIGQPKGTSPNTNITTTTTTTPATTTGVTGQQQLYPVADGDVYAYSYRNWNWANWGQNVTMGAGWNPTGGGRRSYLRFDLPASQGFSRAVLRLYQYHSAGSVHSLGVYRVTSQWNEGTDTYHSGQVEEKADPGELCWMQQPSFDPVPVATFNSANTVPAWVDIDITSLVQKWQGGTANYGLMIKRTNDNPTYESASAYLTKENTDVAHRPVLVLSAGGTVLNAPVITSTTAPAGTALIAESRTAAQGATVQVPVYFQNASNIGSLGFKLNYNPAVAQVIKVSKGSLMSLATFTSNVQSNYIVFAFATPQDINGTGSAAVIEFKAIGVEGSSSPLTISDILATSTSGAKLSVSALNGGLSIGQKQAGDANGDGKVSVIDALIALKMYAQLLPADFILDINKDGRVTPEDARLIMDLSKPK